MSSLTEKSRPKTPPLSENCTARTWASSGPDFFCLLSKDLPRSLGESENIELRSCLHLCAMTSARVSTECKCWGMGRASGCRRSTTSAGPSKDDCGKHEDKLFGGCSVARMTSDLDRNGDLNRGARSFSAPEDTHTHLPKPAQLVLARTFALSMLLVRPLL
ncbi:hypothetical protein GYMLUDRAFT_729662 [Collybiopsis luxurians FD-317 M1]|nr:hypothetical protein GYMLUDRAFT_729662 [Collybiopsis luxurians FD-317 M1]